MDTPRATWVRCRLLGIPLTELAQASPDTLHLYGRRTLSKLLDL